MPRRYGTKAGGAYHSSWCLPPCVTILWHGGGAGEYPLGQCRQAGGMQPQQSRQESREVSAMSYQNIQVETRGRVGIIRLNRPQALNALNSALNAELGSAVAAFDADDGIGCMLITGSEKAFAAGADIKEMADKSATDLFLGDFAGTWHATANARKPVVAAVSGFALGGGCELVMQCDVIIAADTAKFGQPEIKLGI